MRALLSLAAGCLLASCSQLPDTSGRPISKAVGGSLSTGLGRAVRPFNATGTGQSGFHPLGTGSEAFAARMGLAAAAERSLDVQYYIWHADSTGTQLVAALLDAADRGVRVRVLIDDLGTSAKDENLLALDSHPDVEVRLFNPIMTRSARLLGTVFDFGRVNRRMHNKAFIADNQVAIVGGRNIGDEYFDAHKEMNFADFDVAAVGPVVPQVSRSFDDYWNSPSSIGITELTRKRAPPEELAGLRVSLSGTTRDGDAFAADLRRGMIRFLPGRATVVADHPSKVTTGAHETETHLAPKLRELVSGTRREFLIVSPYFIPGKDGVARLVNLRRRGVRVIVLTNSLASTDVAAVHAGYMRYRKELLRAGVELYENKPSGAWKRSGGRSFGGLLGGSRGGSSRASLHAKTFTFDQRRIFVGSMNLDPRSVRLNTEIGVLVECPELARDFTDVVTRELEHNAYRLELEGEEMVWISAEDGKPVRHTEEPQTTGFQRFKAGVLGLLPIEGQL